MHSTMSILRSTLCASRMSCGIYKRLGSWISNTRGRTRNQVSHIEPLDAPLCPTEVHLKALADQFQTRDFDNWDCCHQLLSSAMDVYNTVHLTPGLLEPWSEVTTNLAWYLCKRDSSYIAYTMIVRAVAVREDLFGHHHEKTLASVSILAAILISQGRHSEGIEIGWSAVKGYLRLLGFCHPLTLTSMSNLAFALHCSGKHRTSEILCRLTLSLTKRVLGPGHPDTLTSLNNLALLVRQRGNYRQAINLTLQALKGFEIALGAHHPSTRTCSANLVSLIQCQNDFTRSGICWRSLVIEDPEAHIALLPPPYDFEKSQWTAGESS